MIKLKHIGDSLLLTASTRAIRQQYPDAEISVLVRAGCEGILAGAESIDHVYTSIAPESEKRDLGSHLREFQQIYQLRRQQYDVILELTRGDRGRWWALSLRGKQKATYEMKTGGAFWGRVFDTLQLAPSPRIHATRQDYELTREVLGLKLEEPEPLEFAREHTDPSFAVSQGVVVIHPATRWKRKQWTEVGWQALIESLVANGEQVVLSSGPDRAEVNFCQQLANQFEGCEVEFTGGHLSWAQLAGVLYHAKVFIGVDTAAMHIAAACGTPTVGLFLPWIAPMWHPWKVKHEVVFAEGYPTQARAELNKLSIAVAAMEAITHKQVMTAVERLLSSCTGSRGISDDL